MKKLIWTLIIALACAVPASGVWAGDPDLDNWGVEAAGAQKVKTIRDGIHTCANSGDCTALVECKRLEQNYTAPITNAASIKDLSTWTDADITHNIFGDIDVTDDSRYSKVVTVLDKCDVLIEGIKSVADTTP